MTGVTEAGEADEAVVAPAGTPVAAARRRAVPYALLLVALGVLLAATATAGIAIGSISVPADQVWGILLHRIHPVLAEPDWTPVRETIVVDVRLPRVLLAGVVGAGLSVSGMALQALVRNPLADPMLLGVSSGASVGAVLVLVFHVTLFGMFSLPVAAFCGALAALVAVYFLARSGGRMTTVRLVLAGVAMAEVLSAVASFLIVTSNDPQKTQSALRWMLGGWRAPRGRRYGSPSVPCFSARPSCSGCAGRSTCCWPGRKPPRRWVWTSTASAAPCSPWSP